LEPGCDELRAFFTDQSSGALQWAWDFGDGSTSTEQNPQHLFTYGQTITVTLVVTDNFGCTGSITQTFPNSSFDDYVDYQIPNVFTPNGDGKNDVFTVNSNGFLGPCVNLQVFNRWGQKMFESFGNDITWSGRNMAGEECTTGTYFYTLTLKDMSFNGNVYLNR
jgi:gliding motility-associated-like protein